MSDPSDTEESGSEEVSYCIHLNKAAAFHVLTCWCALQDFQAVDHVAEQTYRVTQEDRDDDAHHEAGVRQIAMLHEV